MIIYTNIRTIRTFEPCEASESFEPFEQFGPVDNKPLAKKPDDCAAAVREIRRIYPNYSDDANDFE